MSGGAPSAVLLDIEGTTTPVDFVYRVLFPYAHARMESYLAAQPAVAQDILALREEHAHDTEAGRNPPGWGDSPTAMARYARWLMDSDRKVTPLKSLQGQIWAGGYAAGEIQGQVYEDVPRALRRWTEARRSVAIFSSGSVLAQKLIFRHSNHGDLSPYLCAYFDTTTGAKGDPASYRKIVAALEKDEAEVLFVSDALVELDAAREAGLATAHALRSDALPTSEAHPPIRTFDLLP